MSRKEVEYLPPGMVMMGNGDLVKLLGHANAPDRWEVLIDTPHHRSHRKRGERGIFWDAGGPNE
jgi:hypothetical protein